MNNKRHTVFARIMLSILLSLILLVAVSCSGGAKSTINSEPEELQQSQEDTAAKEAEEKAAKEAEEKAIAEIDAVLMQSAKAKFYQNILENLPEAFPTLKDSSYDFLFDNGNLFPAETEDDITKLGDFLDASIQYKHLAKDIDPYLDKLMIAAGVIASIKEYEVADGSPLTVIHIVDEEYNSFEIIYYGSVDAYKGDVISCIGLPVAMNYFSNTAGGTTSTVVLIGSNILISE